MPHIRKELEEKSASIEKELYLKGSVHLSMVDGVLVITKAEDFALLKGKCKKELTEQTESVLKLDGNFGVKQGYGKKEKLIGNKI